MNKISILVVDDHALVRMGIVSLLGTVKDFRVVGEADNGQSAVDKARELRPDIVLMDLLMPKKDGIEATQEIKEALPDAKVILLTSAGSSDIISRGIKAGASGAVMKSSDISSLVATIRSVLGGETTLAPEVQKLIDEQPPLQDLSDRQLQILQGITRGLPDRDIAMQLGLSLYTIKEYTNKLFAKLGAANRTEAAIIAERKHLLNI